MDEAGRPVVGARVYYASGPGAFPDLAALTGADGGFALSAPNAGRYEVQVQADGYARQTTATSLKAGEKRTLRIELRKA